MAKRFYVYRILGEMEETVYIGKGTGSRLKDQKRRFKSEGEIIAEFATEGAAYRHEKKLIAIHNPPLNQCSGGSGGIFGRSRSKYNEEMLWECLARCINALGLKQAFFVGIDIKPELKKFIGAMALKYGPTVFSERLERYNITVTHVGELPPESMYAAL